MVHRSKKQYLNHRVFHYYYLQLKNISAQASQLNDWFHKKVITNDNDR